MKQRPHWGDRIFLYVLMTGLGVIAGMQIGTAELRAKNEQIARLVPALAAARATSNACFAEARHDD